MTNPLPYLEQRKLVKRWSGPIAPIANLIFTLILFAITWWIFQDPRGVMRFYTPYVGYNYVNFQRFPTLDAKKLVNAPKMSAHHRGICHF